MVREVITDMFLVTTLANVLRRMSDELRSEILAELRSRMAFAPDVFLSPDEGRVMALAAEEAAANLLDKIERFTGSDAFGSQSHS